MKSKQVHGAAAAVLLSLSLVQMPASAQGATGASGPPPGGWRPQFASPPPGADPLALATTRPGCDADAQSNAQGPLQSIRAYVTAYEAHQKLPETKNFTVSPHPLTHAAIPYYLELRPNMPPPGDGGPGGGPPGGAAGGPPGGGPPGGGPPGGGPGRSGNAGGFRMMRAFLSCAYVTAWSLDDAKAKGIDLEERPRGLLYIPGTGLVAIRSPRMQQGGGRPGSPQ